MSDQKYLLTPHKMNERRMYDQKIKSYMISSVKEQLTWACSSRHGRRNNIQAWAYSSRHDGNHALNHTTVIFGTYDGGPALPNLKKSLTKILQNTKLKWCSCTSIDYYLSTTGSLWERRKPRCEYEFSRWLSRIKLRILNKVMVLPCANNQRLENIYMQELTAGDDTLLRSKII